MNAALTFFESVLEATNNKQDHFLTTTDTKKAFGVVEQNFHLRKLYLDELLLLKNLRSDCSSRIKLAGELSHPINIKQRVSQGGLSTGHNRRYMWKMHTRGSELALLVFQTLLWQMI